MTDWRQLLKPTTELDDLADAMGEEASDIESLPGWIVQLVNDMVLLTTMIERSAIFRLAVWVLVVASLIGMTFGGSRSAWATAALTGMLIIVTQAMTNATRQMAAISREVSDRDNHRSMVRWQAVQHPDHPRTIVLTNISLTAALNVGVVYHDNQVESATAGLDNVGAGMSTRFELPHDPNLEASHWIRIFWHDRWTRSLEDEQSAIVYVVPSKGVALRLHHVHMDEA